MSHHDRRSGGEPSVSQKLSIVSPDFRIITLSMVSPEFSLPLETKNQDMNPIVAPLLYR